MKMEIREIEKKKPYKRERIVNKDIRKEREILNILRKQRNYKYTGNVIEKMQKEKLIKCKSGRKVYQINRRDVRKIK